MTRAAMKTLIARRCGVTIGDAGFSDFLMDDTLNRVTDTFAGPGMDCFWDTETTGIVASQAEYCAPRAYKVKGAYWLDASGNWTPLIPTTPQKMDRGNAIWRNSTTSDTPIMAVFEGVNRVLLYPTPSFTRASALKFEGFMNTNASGASTWAAETAECPLPSWCHEAIAMGATVGICEAMLASDDPAEVAKASRLLPVWGPEYVKLRGSAEAAACTWWQDAVSSGRIAIAPYFAGWSY